MILFSVTYYAIYFCPFGLTIIFSLEIFKIILATCYCFMQGDVETLKKYCSSEVIERCKGERQAYESQGIFFDSKVRCMLL